MTAKQAEAAAASKKRAARFALDDDDLAGFVVYEGTHENEGFSSVVRMDGCGDVQKGKAPVMVWPKRNSGGKNKWPKRNSGGTKFWLIL